MANQKEQGKKMGVLIAKARSDDVFKKVLLSDPESVLEEGGIEIPWSEVKKILKRHGVTIVR